MTTCALNRSLLVERPALLRSISAAVTLQHVSFSRPLYCIGGVALFALALPVVGIMVFCCLPVSVRRVYWTIDLSNCTAIILVVRNGVGGRSDGGSVTVADARGAAVSRLTCLARKHRGTLTRSRLCDAHDKCTHVFGWHQSDRLSCLLWPRFALGLRLFCNRRRSGVLRYALKRHGNGTVTTPPDAVISWI